MKRLSKTPRLLVEQRRECQPKQKHQDSNDPSATAASTIGNGNWWQWPHRPWALFIDGPLVIRPRYRGARRRSFQMIQKWTLSSLLLSCRLLCCLVSALSMREVGCLLSESWRLALCGTIGTTGRLLYMGTRLWWVDGRCVLW